MKLIEKKCPGCGAGLKFGENDTSATCEYCNKTFHIQRDEMKFTQLADKHLDRAYQFVDEYGKPIATGVARAFMIPVIVIFVFAALVITGIGFTIYKIGFDEPSNTIDDLFEDLDSTKKENFENERKNLVTKLEQIDAVSLQTFRDASLNKVKNISAGLGSGHGWAGHSGGSNNVSLEKDWTSVGSYLLVGKDTNENILYDVYLHSFKIKSTKKTVTLYVAVKYRDLKLTDNGIVNHSYSGSTEAPELDLITGDSFSSSNGYESLEKLYNQLIRSQSGTYTIEGTEGMYVEKAN